MSFLQLVIFFLIPIFLYLSACSERKKENPFEPDVSIPVTLDLTAYDSYIEIKWNDPGLSDITGFNLYRSDTGEPGSYALFAGQISPETRQLIDQSVIQQQKYYYYLTLIGINEESKPSRIASAMPGPGFPWVVDKWGYELVKLTYDLQKPLLRIQTPWPPHDLAIASHLGIGLVVYPSSGKVQIFDLVSAVILAQTNAILYPYAVEFDSTESAFWIVDSSGFLYKLYPDFPEPLRIYDQLDRPVSITCAENAGFLYVSDSKLQKVLQFKRNGELSAEYTNLRGDPYKFLHDEIYDRVWLLEKSSGLDYIYTREFSDTIFTFIDSLNTAEDIELMRGINGIYLVEFDGINSSVVQLSASGTRQIAVTGFTYLIDIDVNKYDFSLLTLDLGLTNGILTFYSNNILLGSYRSLYLPQKVVIE